MPKMSEQAKTALKATESPGGLVNEAHSARKAARKQARDEAKALLDKGKTEDPTSEWLNRAVVVVAEDSPRMGRAGGVVKVCKVGD